MSRFDEVCFEEESRKFLDLRTGADVSAIIVPIGVPILVSFQTGSYDSIRENAPKDARGYVVGGKIEVFSGNIIPVQYVRFSDEN